MSNRISDSNVTFRRTENGQPYNLAEHKPTEEEKRAREERNQAVNAIHQTHTELQIKRQARIMSTPTGQVSQIMEDMAANSKTFQYVVMTVCFINIFANALIGFQAAYQYPTLKFECMNSVGAWESCKEDQL